MTAKLQSAARWLFFLCLASHVNLHAATPQENLQRLITTLLSEDTQAPDELSPTLTLATELGEYAIPTLLKILQSAGNNDHRRRVSRALAYIGGTSVVDVLQDQASRTRDIQAKALFCFSVPSAPSAKRIEALIHSLDGQHIGLEWPPIVQSAHSLGILKAQVAIPGLQKAANKHEGGASYAAEEALSWIRDPLPNIVFQTSGPNDDLIHAIFKTGVPSLSRFSQYCEKVTPNRKWKKSGGNWTIDAGCAAKSAAPAIHFESFRSSDGLRALVSLEFYVGPLDGIGYNYILRKKDGKWIVVGLEHTWTS